MCYREGMRQILLAMLCLFASVQGRDSVLVWHDEFDVPGQPDPTRWTWDEGGSGMGNDEAQFYTRNRPANARVEDGQLVITARREDTLTCWYGPCKFTSARLVTRGIASWLYGRVEVRAKLPRGTGTWPAIWMLAERSPYGSWPTSGEIDIMEAVGHEPGKVFANVHTRAYNHVDGTAKGSSKTVTDPVANWHVYSLEWGPDSLFIGVDGTDYYRFGNQGTWQTWPFDQPFHLLLNLAVGGGWGGAQGIDTTVFPQEFRVDWVRVHKIDRGDGPYTLVPGASGAGRVVLSPVKSAYDALDTVIATALPDPGWEFVRWKRADAAKRPVDTFLVDHGGPVDAVFLPRGERIENGDFSQGLAGWWSWNDASVPTTISVVDGRACIKVQTAGTSDWKSQLDWPGLQLTKGETWELSYRTDAVASRPLGVLLVMHHEPHEALATPVRLQIPAGTSTRTLRFAIDATDSLARLEFDFGTDTTSFCLDSVSLRRISPNNAIRPRTSRPQRTTRPSLDASGRILPERDRGAFTVRIAPDGASKRVSSP